MAVVTGAAGGIGAAICRRLADDGFAVACVDLRGEDAAGVAGGIPGARGYGADVSDAASVRSAAERVRRDLGVPWLLVNAAGVFSIQRITDLDESEWDRILDTNLKGPYLTCREFLPAMTEAGDGCIVNIAATAGLRGGRRRAAPTGSASTPMRWPAGRQRSPRAGWAPQRRSPTGSPSSPRTAAATCTAPC